MYGWGNLCVPYDVSTYRFEGYRSADEVESLVRQVQYNALVATRIVVLSLLHSTLLTCATSLLHCLRGIFSIPIALPHLHSSAAVGPVH
jgi:hypothetical protein